MTEHPDAKCLPATLQCVVSANAKRSACATPNHIQIWLTTSVFNLHSVAPSWRECWLLCSPHSGCALPSVKRVLAMPKSVTPPPPGGITGTLFPLGDSHDTPPQYCMFSRECFGVVTTARISTERDGWPSVREHLCASTFMGVATCPSPSVLLRQLPTLSGMRPMR